MIVGYIPGRGPLHRAHPFTALTVAGAAAVLALALPGPWGPPTLAALAVVLALIERVPRTLVTALVIAFPFWIFAVLLHGVLGDAPDRAITLAGRITAMIVAFLTVLAAVHPARLVDALVERRVPFAAAYLLSATLQTVPRLRDRARAILDAQRCRGLRIRGSPWRRVRAVVPLAVPLVLGALAEVDERALALEARGASSSSSRTPLDPPADPVSERTSRWLLTVAVLGVVLFRLIP